MKGTNTKSISLWVVEVVEYGTGEVVRRTAPAHKKAAEKIDAGLNINLNHERFYTRFVEAPDETK